MRLYLAGPDVFAPDADRRFQSMRKACISAGHRPLTPMESELPDGLTGPAAAAWIKKANQRLIDGADAVVANITPFRGPNMDPGTAWEIGYAEAKGLPVVLWSEEPMLLEERTPGVGDRDHEGWLVERFGLAENLMIAVNLYGVAPSFEAALARILEGSKACEIAPGSKSLVS